MSQYKRKTEDEYEIQSLWSGQWECVTTESTWREAKTQVKCYRDNEPHIAHRIVKKRVKKESEAKNA